jgi:glycosyltransferase involved in cell wall biosynthesis
MENSFCSPSVAVLLATHHPEKFLLDQIKSIQNQVDVNITVYWGDDGSTPDERERVRGLLQGTRYVEVPISSEGASHNFFALLNSAVKEEYFAFADQDDIWLPRKLSTHIQALKKFEAIPAISHSNSALLYGDSIKTKKSRCQKHQIRTLLVENCCQGCTMVLNSKARAKVLSAPTEDVFWHDWWIALVISVTGCIIFVEGIDTLYRQHENNAIGHPSFRRRAYRSMTRGSGLLSKQATALQKYFGAEIENLSSIELEKWQSLCTPSRIRRLSAIIHDVRRRQNYLEDVARRILNFVRIP